LRQVGDLRLQTPESSVQAMLFHTPPNALLDGRLGPDGHVVDLEGVGATIEALTSMLGIWPFECKIKPEPARNICVVAGVPRNVVVRPVAQHVHVDEQQRARGGQHSAEGFDSSRCHASPAPEVSRAARKMAPTATARLNLADLERHVLEGRYRGFLVGAGAVRSN
jgi:hypothetical protein